MSDRKILCIVDANFNRAKEGLRVVEDILRFALLNDKLRIKVRKLRHSFNKIAKLPIVQNAILERDSNNDLGRKLDKLELKRKDLQELIIVNLQRVKEAARVLEEIFKIVEPKQTAYIKNIRYSVYTLEKELLIFISK